MKYIRKLITLLLVLMLGFWLGATGLLSGTTVGSWMDTAVTYLPDARDINNLRLNMSDTPLLSDPLEMDVENQDDLPPAQESRMIEDHDVNYALIETTIIELVNELRQEQAISTLDSNDMLKTAATIRAQETEEHFSHTRPDGSDAFTVFDTEGIHYPYRMVGENLGMATYYLNEEDMAELLFNGWVESEGHYENMIRPDYEEIGVGVHYDGEFLYATQLFGTPL